MLDITQNHYAENYAIAGVGNTVKEFGLHKEKELAIFSKMM